MPFVVTEKKAAFLAMTTTAWTCALSASEAYWQPVVVQAAALSPALCTYSAGCGVRWGSLSLQPCGEHPAPRRHGSAVRDGEEQQWQERWEPQTK